MSSALGFEALHGVDPVATLHAPYATNGMTCAVADVVRERGAQIAKWGDDSTSDHPDGTGGGAARVRAKSAQTDTDIAALVPGRVTWRHILAEEVAEAFAETDPAALRAELVQVAAVAVKWIEALDRRTADEAV